MSSNNQPTLSYDTQLFDKCSPWRGRWLDTGADWTFEVFPWLLLDIGALKMLGVFSSYYGIPNS